MHTIRLLTDAVCLAGVCLLLWGCGNGAPKLSAEDLAAFKDAAPEIKQAWERALKADKANDYLAASTDFRSLLGKNITTEQLVAVQAALGGLNYRMNDAAAKGDASAQKALEAVKQSAPRR